MMGSCDPYVVASLGKQEQQTSVKKGVYSASWPDEVLPFYMVDVAQPVASSLRLSVMDWDRMGNNEEVGRASIPADTISKVCRCAVGWEGEATYNVLNAESDKEVVGKDSQKCTLTVRVRIMGETLLAPPELRSDVESREKLLEVSGAC